MKQFYLVWRENGPHPKHLHSTYQSAKDEACRLAIKEGGRFHVLASAGSAEPPARVTFTHHQPSADSPF